MAENKEKRENSRIISSDDPDALEKLRKKLEDLQAHQEYMKRANAYYKKHRTMRGFEDMPENDAAKMDSYILSAYFDQKPYPSYILQNNNANMRRVKERIRELEKRGQSSFGEGWHKRMAEAVKRERRSRPAAHCPPPACGTGKRKWKRILIHTKGA